MPRQREFPEDRDSTTILHMRCHAEQREAWKNAAAAEDLKLATWVRRVLNKEVARIRDRERKDNGHKLGE